MPIRVSRTFLLAVVLFVLSGALGLGYELIWIQKASLLVGASQIALATVLTSFFLGLALGSLFVGRYLRSSRWSPLFVYGLFEVAIGVFFNQVLPTSFGGDGVRIWLLSKIEAPIDVALRSVVIDRGVGLFGLLLLNVAVAPALVLSIDKSIATASVIVISITATASVVFLKQILLFLRKIFWKSIRKYLDPFIRDLDAVLRNKPQLGGFLLLSILGHVVTCLGVWLTALAFGIEIPVGASLVVIAPVLLAAALPISIGGWGVREGGMIFGLGMLGVSSSDAVLVSIVIGLMGVAIGAVGGLVWLLTGGRDPRRNRLAS